MLNMMMRADASCARTRRASSNPDTVGRLISITQISGRSAVNTRSPLSASEASSSTISGSSARTARQPEATMGWSSTIRMRMALVSNASVSLLHRISCMSSGAKPSTDHATQAMLLYASIRWPRHCLSTLLLVRNRMQRRSRTHVMWQKLSLRARINLLLAFVLTLGLAINIARLVLEAAPRVQAEDQSVIRLAREFIDTIVAGLNEAPDPDARLNQIVQDLNRLRHVSITR